MNTPYKEERPWGDFEQFCHNEEVTVKIITVKPSSKLSLQFHHHRDEYWRVISGSGCFVIGEELRTVVEGDECFIPKETVHRMMTTDHEMKVLEIAYGTFDEEDIVRLEDDYDRVSTPMASTP